MIPELGHFSLILALVFSVIQAAIPISVLRTRAAILNAILLLTAFFCLGWSYVTSDFTVENVAANSHTLKPLLYKITGIWGNHEGSMLLWALVLALYGLALAQSRRIPDTIKNPALMTQAILATGFLAFVIFTSNPFARLSLPPLDGAGLNPVLQDFGLAVHPPLLYLGYVGFSAVFSLAVAALLSGQMNKDWAQHTKPFLLFAWSSLSAGIALGSWWAYYELGWGGWWFWDPVENASLLPWLTGTALLHSICVLEKRGGLQKWCAFLAILTFSLSMLGTFLVRSGVLTSVHAFASDPARGIFILCLLTAFTGGAFLLYALRVPKLEATPLHFQPLSRESTLILNNLFTLTACATVLTGTLYPLIMDGLGAGAVSVGAPYFNTTVIPLALPALVLMGAAPTVAWKKANLKTLWPRLSTALLMTLAGAVLMAVFAFKGAPLVWAGFLIALWLIFATTTEWITATRGSWPRIRGLPLSRHGMSLSHLGMGIAVLGMIGSTVWMQEKITIMRPGDQIDIGRYTLRLESLTADFGENYAADSARFGVYHFGTSKPFMTLTPQRRYYPAAQKTTTEAAIHTSLRDDLYLAIGDSMSSMTGQDSTPHAADERIVRAYVHPLIPCLWTGFILIALGGMLCLMYRKKEAPPHE